MPILKMNSSLSTPRKAIKYVTRKDKAEYIDTQNIICGSPGYLARQFRDTMSYFGKGDKPEERKYYHFKLSPKRGEVVDPFIMQEYAKELSELLFSDAQVVIATHTDTPTTHAHLVINAIDPVTGRKLHFQMSDFEKMKDEANRIGKKYGFSETEFRTPPDERKPRGGVDKPIKNDGRPDYKKTLRGFIDEALLTVSSEGEYKSFLKKHGVEITRSGVEYSYKCDGAQRAVKGDKLGNDKYKKENLLNVILGRNRIEIGSDGGDIARTACDGNAIKGNGANADGDETTIVSTRGNVASESGSRGGDASERGDGEPIKERLNGAGEGGDSSFEGVVGSLKREVQSSFGGADEGNTVPYDDEQFDGGADQDGDIYTAEQLSREFERGQWEAHRHAEDVCRAIRNAGERIDRESHKEDGGDDNLSENESGGDLENLPGDYGNFFGGSENGESGAQRGDKKAASDKEGDGGPFKDKH